MAAEARSSISSEDDKSEVEESAGFSRADRLIVMPVDGSEHSERAFEWYVDNIMQPRDGLLLVHIVEPVSPGINYGITSRSSTAKDEFARQMEKLIDGGRVLRTKYLKLCESLNIPSRFTIHVGTKPGEHIVRLSQKQSANLVIVGNRGIGSLRRTFLGSVSDYILHNVNVPVIVVPPKKVAKKK